MRKHVYVCVPRRMEESGYFYFAWFFIAKLCRKWREKGNDITIMILHALSTEVKPSPLGLILNLWPSIMMKVWL